MKSKYVKFCDHHFAYADLLLETGHHGEALEQYRAVLDGSPNRLNALLGAARAAHGNGDMVLEARYRSIVSTQIKDGNGARREQI